MALKALCCFSRPLGSSLVCVQVQPGRFPFLLGSSVSGPFFFLRLALVWWSPGPLVPWCSGPLVPGLLVPWSPGPLVSGPFFSDAAGHTWGILGAGLANVQNRNWQIRGRV